MTPNAPSILDEDLPILIRESLTDQGSHECINHSPDIIVQKFKLSGPRADLCASYDRDISKDNDGSGMMYIYVRFKNISDKPLGNFYIHLYRNHLGLYNAPRDWSQYEMKTEDGEPVLIEALGPQEIGVTPAFIYDSAQTGVHPNCFVAVATRERNPKYSSVNSYVKYIRWINKKNVAARNVCVRHSSVHRCEQTAAFHNPNGKACMFAFMVEVQAGSASGTRYGMRYTPLGIAKENVYVAGSPNSDFLYAMTRLPADYTGELLVWDEVLEGDYIELKITYWALVEQGAESAIPERYCVDLGERFGGIAEMDSLPLQPQRAVLLGGCVLRNERRA